MKKISLFAGVMVMAVCFLFTSCGDKGVTDVTLDKTSLSLEIGGTATLTATVAPGDAEDKTVSWKSSNSAVATVSNGKVTAVATGTATITVTTTDGAKTAICNVTVSAGTVVASSFMVTFKGSTFNIPASGVYGAESNGKLIMYAFKNEPLYAPFLDICVPASTGTHTVEVDGSGMVSTWLEYCEEYLWEGDNYDFYDWTLVTGGSFAITAYNSATKTFSGTFTGQLTNQYAVYYGVADTERQETISVTMTNVTWQDMSNLPSSKNFSDKNLRIAKRVAAR